MLISRTIIDNLRGLNIKFNDVQEVHILNSLDALIEGNTRKVEKAFCLSLLSEVHDLRQVEKVLVHYNNSKRKAL